MEITKEYYEKFKRDLKKKHLIIILVIISLLFVILIFLFRTTTYQNITNSIQLYVHFQNGKANN